MTKTTSFIKGGLLPLSTHSWGVKMSEGNQDAQDNDLLDRVNQKIDQTGLWYITWDFYDLVKLADNPIKKVGDKKPSYSPIEAPATTLSADDKLQLVKYLPDGKMPEFYIALAQAEDGTIEQRIHVVPTGGELHFNAKSIRDAVNDAFGEADDKICEQEGLFSDHLTGNDVYTPSDLEGFCDQLKESLGYSFSEVPEDVRFLAKVSDWDYINRRGLQRITASPWAMAMTYLPDHVKRYDEKCENDAEKELHQKHRQIIVGALLSMQPEEFLSDATAEHREIRDAWDKREKLQFDEKEIDVLLPKPSIKGFMASAKELGDDYRNQAVRAFELYGEIRNAYKAMLKRMDLQEFFS